jgi:DNA helicase HerA-like ATPase
MADKKYFAMAPNLEYLWLFGRKRGVSVIGATQAPRFVPSALYDQSRMHFIFRLRDRRAQRRLAEISGDIDTLEEVTPNLELFEFAYVNPLGDVVRSMFSK